MKLWLDAQFAPSLADWLNEHFSVSARALRDLGLRDAEDQQIFDAAQCHRRDKRQRLRAPFGTLWTATAGNLDPMW